MSTSIELAFVKQFEREVHEAYQRMGSKLRSTVRSKSNIKGASTVFQKVGTGVAGTKARNGQIPVMNVNHEAVECILADYYAGDWIDKLDELKTSIDERAVIANAGAYPLRDVYKRQGQRYAVVGWKQWSQLLGIPEFADADYVGPDELPWRGTQAKRWLGSLWMPHSGLKVENNVRLCHWYHRTAVGHASGSDVQTDVTWHGDRASHFVNNMMSQGAVLIDAKGIVTLRCLE